MSFIRKSVYAVGGFFVLLAVIGILLPSTAHVQREIEIEAPAASVFALLNDFNQVNKWSPWVDTDPNALFTITGPPRGVGASIAWDGRTLGKGSQTIVESVPFSRLVTRLDLGSQGSAVATFDLSKSATGTQVVWSFDNDFGFNLPGRYFGLLLDGIVGPDYENGLINLKSMAERLPAADFGDIEIEHRTVEATDIAYLPTSSVPEAKAISGALGDAYFKLLNFIDKHELREAGAPMSIGGDFNGSELQFTAAIPIRGLGEDLPANASGVRVGRSYAGKVIRVKHTGSYRTLGRTHDKIAAYLAALGIRRNGDAWESYVSDPTRVEESELLTYVYYPVVQDP